MRLEMALKKPTYTPNAIRTSKKALLNARDLIEVAISGFRRFPESEGGVGGFEGIKKVGRHATQDWDISAL
jgi:hypothetical protein